MLSPISYLVKLHPLILVFLLLSVVHFVTQTTLQGLSIHVNAENYQILNGILDQTENNLAVGTPQQARVTVGFSSTKISTTTSTSTSQATTTSSNPTGATSSPSTIRTTTTTSSSSTISTSSQSSSPTTITTTSSSAVQVSQIGKVVSADPATVTRTKVLPAIGVQGDGDENDEEDEGNGGGYDRFRTLSRRARSSEYETLNPSSQFPISISTIPSLTSLSGSCIAGITSWPLQLLRDSVSQSFTFLFFQLWVLVLTIIGIKSESFNFLGAVIISHVLELGFEIWQINKTSQIRKSFESLPGCSNSSDPSPSSIIPNYFSKTHQLQLGIIVTELILTLGMGLCMTRLGSVMSWRSFKKFGADRRWKKFEGLLTSYRVGVLVVGYFLGGVQINLLVLGFDPLPVLFNPSTGSVRSEEFLESCLASKFYLTFLSILTFLLPVWLLNAWFAVSFHKVKIFGGSKKTKEGERMLGSRFGVGLVGAGGAIYVGNLAFILSQNFLKKLNWGFLTFLAATSIIFLVIISVLGVISLWIEVGEEVLDDNKSQFSLEGPEYEEKKDLEKGDFFGFPKNSEVFTINLSSKGDSSPPVRATLNSPPSPTTRQTVTSESFSIRNAQRVRVDARGKKEDRKSNWSVKSLSKKLEIRKQTLKVLENRSSAGSTEFHRSIIPTSIPSSSFASSSFHAVSIPSESGSRDSGVDLRGSLDFRPPVPPVPVILTKKPSIKRIPPPAPLEISRFSAMTSRDSMATSSAHPPPTSTNGGDREMNSRFSEFSSSDATSTSGGSRPPTRIGDRSETVLEIPELPKIPRLTLSLEESTSPVGGSGIEKGNLSDVMRQPGWDIRWSERTEKKMWRRD